ncbi:LamG domain-containing protein [bacterium]|nr:LamG domain-containing protein [bacterium]
MRTGAVLCCLCLATALAWPLDQGDVLFYAPFDGTVTPALAVGDKTPRTAGQPTFQSGKHGQAVVCQDKQFGLSYAAPGNLNPQHGSLSLWVAPVAWRHGDGRNHNFMVLRGEPSYLLYTYISLPTYFLQLEGGNPRVGTEVDWQPGEWHHLVATWQDRDFRLYVDGKLRSVDSETMSLPRQTGDLFDVGSHNFGCEDATAFDELILFRRALAAEEIAALHEWTLSPEGQASQAPVPSVADVPLLQASLRHFPMAGRVEVTVRPTGVGLADGQALPVQASLLDAAGKSQASQQANAFLGRPSLLTFDVGKLGGATYRVAVSAGTARPLELAFERRAQPEWLGNTIGLDGSVPAPWTPVEVAQRGKETRVRTWGREMLFAGGLCDQVTTQGQALLSAPIGLHLQEKGAPASCEMGPAAVTSRTPEAIVLSSTGTLAPLQLRIQTTCEFDGFTWFEIELTPPATGAAVDSLALEMPFARDQATLLYSGTYYPSLDNGTGGITPAGFTGGWRPWFWVGNERGGLEWCAEDHRGWVLSKPKEALSVVPTASSPPAPSLQGGGAVMVRLNIVDKPTKLTQPLKLAFGLQATPVKPQRADRRRWRAIGQQPGTGLEKTYMLPADRHVRGVTLWNEGWTDTWMIPKPRPTAKDTIAKREQEGIRPCMYLATHTVDPREEWVRYYWDYWRTTPGETFDPAWLADKSYYVEAGICQASGYQDYFIWLLDRAIQSTDLKGLYFDNSVSRECDNALHGCGAAVPVARQEQAAQQDPSGPRYPILAARQFYKRVYRLMRAHAPDSLIAIHMSGWPLMPLQAFADIICDGENFTGYMQVVKKEKGWDNYWHTLPLDVMRAQYRNHWGPETAFLPEFGRALGKEWNENTAHTRESVEHLIGLYFIHDSGLWPCWSTLEPYGRFFQAQDRFGWDEQVAFVPYWDLQGLASISTTADLSHAQPPEEAARAGNPPLVMSLFRRPGKVMFVPYNNTDQDLPVTISWEAAKLGVGPATELEDIFRGTKAKVTGQQVTVTVPKRNFGMWTAP